MNDFDWHNLKKDSVDYHTSQYDTPKSSTVSFYNFFEKEIGASKTVIDIAGGSGAFVAYLAKRHPETQFTIFDISDKLITIGKKHYFLSNRILFNISWGNS